MNSKPVKEDKEAPQIPEEKKEVPARRKDDDRYDTWYEPEDEWTR